MIILIILSPRPKNERISGPKADNLMFLIFLKKPGKLTAGQEDARYD